MATEQPIYLSYEEAVLIHIRLMQMLDETRYGVDFRDLIESALARPKNAAIYENADIIPCCHNTLRKQRKLDKIFLTKNIYEQFFYSKSSGS